MGVGAIALGVTPRSPRYGSWCVIWLHIFDILLAIHGREDVKQRHVGSGSICHWQASAEVGSRRPVFDVRCLAEG